MSLFNWWVTYACSCCFWEHVNVFWSSADKCIHVPIYTLISDLSVSWYARALISEVVDMLEAGHCLLEGLISCSNSLIIRCQWLVQLQKTCQCFLFLAYHHQTSNLTLSRLCLCRWVVAAGSQCQPIGQKTVSMQRAFTSIFCHIVFHAVACEGLKCVCARCGETPACHRLQHGTHTTSLQASWRLAVWVPCCSIQSWPRWNWKARLQRFGGRRQ